MVSKMLMAITQMLETKGEETESYDLLEARVKCARLMLIQIVGGMEETTIKTISIPSEVPLIPLPFNKGLKPEPVVDEFPLDPDEVYEIKWDNTPEGKVLRGITNVDGEDFIEMDGVRMQLKDALGKVMTKGVKVL